MDMNQSQSCFLNHKDVEESEKEEVHNEALKELIPLNEAAENSIQNSQEMEAITELYHRLTRQVTKQQSEKNVYRKELNQLKDERDQLLKMLVGKDAAMNNVQFDLKSLEDQFQSISAEICCAITRYAEMATREQTLLDREKVLEKEIDRLNGEIIALTRSLNKTTSELVALKQNNASAGAQMVTDLKETLEELRVANLTICRMEGSYQLIESKYANEMLAHSSDLQTLTSLKKELSKSDEQVHQLKLAEDEAFEMFKSCQLEWETINKKSNKNLQQLKRRVEYLEMQNMELRAQNSKFFTSSSVKDKDDTDANISITITDEELEKLRSDRRFTSTCLPEEDIRVTQTDIINFTNFRHLTDRNTSKVNELTVKEAKIEAQLLPLLSKKFEENPQNERSRVTDDGMDDVVNAGIGCEIINMESSDENQPNLVDTMSQASSGIGESSRTEAYEFTSQLTAAAKIRETDKDLSMTRIVEDVTSGIEAGDGGSDTVSLEGSDTVQTIDHQKPSNSYQRKSSQVKHMRVEKPYNSLSLFEEMFEHRHNNYRTQEYAQLHKP